MLRQPRNVVFAPKRSHTKDGDEFVDSRGLQGQRLVVEGHGGSSFEKGRGVWVKMETREASAGL